MLTAANHLIGTFTGAEQIGTTWQSMLWILPLSAAIASVYKATKLPTITAKSFIKETFVLFVSIAAFMAAAGAGLYLIGRVISE